MHKFKVYQGLEYSRGVQCGSAFPICWLVRKFIYHCLEELDPSSPCSLCSCSPAHMGKIRTFARTAKVAPIAIEYSRSMEVVIGFPIRYAETMIKQYVKPYSYGASDGHSFMNDVTAPVTC